MKTLVVIGACFLVLAASFAAHAQDAAVWANGFDENNAGFERALLLTDAVVVRYLENGKVFVSKSESLAFAKDIADEIGGILVKNDYPAPESQHFFSAAYSNTTRKTAFDEGKPISDQTAPMHIDPDVARLAALQSDALEALRLTADLVSGKTTPGAASIAPESAQRLAGNFRTNTIGVCLVVTHREDKPVREFAEPDPDRVNRLESPLLAVAYYQADTGKLVYFHKRTTWKKQKENVFYSAVHDLHKDFPKARVGGRFAYPPAPRFDTSKSKPGADDSGFFVDSGAVMPGFETMRFGVIQARGPVPFSKTPTANRADTVLISPGTTVRVIGNQSIYTKVVLKDGRVGWVPTDSVWVRALP